MKEWLNSRDRSAAHLEIKYTDHFAFLNIPAGDCPPRSLPYEATAENIFKNKVMRKVVGKLEIVDRTTALQNP